jgi:hypothetical protein
MLGPRPQTFAALKRRAFTITDTELRLIAAAANMGDRRSPNAG